MKISLRGLGPREKPKGNWADRSGPWILSACLHTIFACLVFSGLAYHQEMTKRTLRLNLNKAFPKPQAISLKSLPPPPLLPSRANAPENLPPQPKPAEPTNVIAQSASTAAPEPVPQQSPPSPPAPLPSGAVAPQIAAPAPADGSQAKMANAALSAANQQARIQRILAAYSEKSQVGQQALHGEHESLQDRLETAGLQAAAAPHFPGYSGARVGAIRTLTFDNVSPTVAREVMARYQIRITTGRFMKQSGPSYLNSAASGGSVFTPQDKPGLYDVFEISPKAYQQMVVLEQNWLISHGYDPRATRVDTVEFGIVPKGSIYDLGILKMEVQQLTEIGRPSIGPGGIAASSAAPTTSKPIQ